MKFAAKLSAHLTPEWRKQYIDYDGLKEFLLTFIDKKIRDLKDWDVDFVKFLDDQDVDFFDLCISSLEKIESFFGEKLAEANRKFSTLLEELDAFFQTDKPKFSSFRATLSRRHYGSSRQSYVDHSEAHRIESCADRSIVDSVSEGKPELVVHERRKRSSPNLVENHPVKQRRRKKKYRRLNDLKLAFSEFYLNLVLLQNYQVLNYTGFRKILKKHDKLFRRDNGLQWRLDNVDGAKFNMSREIDDLITKVEDIYAEKLEHGDRSKTMKRLRVPPLTERYNPKAVFRFGFFAGIFLVQALIIILSYIFLRPLPENNIPALRMFQSTFLLILFLCLFGLNTYGWRSSGVNHVLIFELNPRSHLDHFQLLEVSFFLAVVWGCAVLYYMYSEVLHVPGYVSPFLLFIFLAVCLVNPFRIFQHRARRWLLRLLGRIILAPWYEVKFADFWLADQLNSLNFLFPEMAFFFCFYASQVSWSGGFRYTPLLVSGNNTQFTSPTQPACALSGYSFIANSCQCSGLMFGIEPILRCLPAWFRFAQCLRRYRDMPVKRISPHIINAGKYSTTFIVAACKVWFDIQYSKTSLIFLIFACLLNSTYTYAWDIHMDWGLFECTPPNRLLREETVYQYPAYYYVAIIENFILRFTWTLLIGITETVTTPKYLVASVLSTAEVVRRFIWNFFRLENEHLNNCGEFRAVRDIFIRPERRETFTNPHNSHNSFDASSMNRSLTVKNKNAGHKTSGDSQQLIQTRNANSLDAVQRIRQWISPKMFCQVRRLRNFDQPANNIELVESGRGSHGTGVTVMTAESHGDFRPNTTLRLHYGSQVAHDSLTYPAGSDAHASKLEVDTDTVNLTSETTMGYNTSTPRCQVHLPGSMRSRFGKCKFSSRDSVSYVATSNIQPALSDTSTSMSGGTSWNSDTSSEPEANSFHPTATAVTLLSDGYEHVRGSEGLISNLPTDSYNMEYVANRRPEFTTNSSISLESIKHVDIVLDSTANQEQRYGTEHTELENTKHSRAEASDNSAYPRKTINVGVSGQVLMVPHELEIHANLRMTD